MAKSFSAMDNVAHFRHHIEWTSLGFFITSGNVIANGSQRQQDHSREDALQSDDRGPSGHKGICPQRQIHHSQEIEKASRTQYAAGRNADAQRKCRKGSDPGPGESQHLQQGIVCVRRRPGPCDRTEASLLSTQATPPCRACTGVVLEASEWPALPFG